MSYAEYISQTLAPISLQGPNGTKWCTGLGEEKDALKQRVIDSIALRFPTYAPADSLLQHGLDRQIERAPGEPDASYRKRLLKAHATWKWSGTDYGIMLSFEALGWTIAHVDPYDSWPADYPFQTDGIASYPWAGSAESVKGTPVALMPEMVPAWSMDDPNGELSNLVLVGTSGPVYLRAVEASPDIRVSVYADEAMLTQIAYGEILDGWDAGGAVTLIAVGGSGVSGTVDAGPEALGATYPVVATIVLVPSGTLGAAPTTSFDPARIGYVLDDGVTPGDSVRVGTTRSNVWIIPTREWGALPVAGYGWAAEWPVLDYHAQTTAVRYLPFHACGYTGAGAGALFNATASVFTTGAVIRSSSTGPTARAFPAMSTWGENVVLFGGRDVANNPLSDMWIWDSQHDDWQAFTPWPAPAALFGACMAELGGKLVLFGGKAVVAEDTTLVFDAGGWNAATPGAKPSASFHGAMATLGDCVYHFGGTADGLNAIAAATRKFDGTTWSLVTTAHTPPKRWGHTITRVGNVLVMFGGRDGATIYNDWWTFDGTDWTWQGDLAGRQTYWHAAAAISDHELLVWGGQGNDAVFVLNIATGAVTNGTPLPEPTWGAGSCGIVERVTTVRRGLGVTRDGTYMRGTAMLISDRDAMIASIRKWKAGELTVPEMLIIASDGGFSDCRGPMTTRAAETGIRGGRVVRVPVGES
jgi:hypothetical protein